MHVDHNMHVIDWNMHVTCTLFRIGLQHNVIISSEKTFHDRSDLKFRQNKISRINLVCCYSRGARKVLLVNISRVTPNNENCESYQL